MRSESSMDNLLSRQVEKADLRRAGRELRAALSSDERAKKSWQICAQLARLCAELVSTHLYCSRQATAIYLANAIEANVEDFAREILARGSIVVAPRLNILPPFYTLQSTLENVEIISFGAKQLWVRQPHRFQGGRTFELSEIGIFVVPGVAFDANGNRIGQGGGWYDKILCKAPHAVVIGACFDCQLFPTVPREAHDCAVHYIVTESQTLKTGVPIFQS